MEPDATIFTKHQPRKTISKKDSKPEATQKSQSPPSPADSPKTATTFGKE